MIEGKKKIQQSSEESNIDSNSKLKGSGSKDDSDKTEEQHTEIKELETRNKRLSKNVV